MTSAIATAEGIQPCPHCGQRDWQIGSEGVMCGACFEWAEKDAPAEARRKTHKQRGGTLTELIGKEREVARLAYASLGLSESDLARWLKEQYGGQLARTSDKIAALFRWLEGSSPEVSPDNYWLADARLRYAEDTNRMLREAKHALFCPDHAPEGVAAEHAEGLALRGLLEPAGRMMAWWRYCEADALNGWIKQTAARLKAEWQK